MTKFENLINTYNKNKCTNIIHDSCLLIDLIDYTNQQNSIDFLNNVIIKKIDSNEIKTNIYFKLLSYQYLSINLISFIIYYLIKNNNELNNQIESLIRLKLSDIKNTPIIKCIFEEINRKIIKEEDLFSEEKNIEFFTLLKNIQKIINIQSFVNKGYINKIIKLKNSIINNLKNGNIQYKLIHLWLNDNEKKKLLLERLDIISFGNKNEVNDCLNSLDNYFIQINETVKYIKRIKEKIKLFFPIEQQKITEFLDDYENIIGDGFLIEVNENVYNFIEDLDLDEMDKLKSSTIFLNLFNSKRTSNNSITNVINKFRKAKKDLNKFRLLFNDYLGKNNLLEEYSNIFKELIKNENELEKELLFLKNYFNIENQDISEIKNDLILYNKKEELLKDLNHLFNLISKLSPKNIQLSNEIYNLKLLISNNINLDLLKNYDNIINEFMSNISKKNKNTKNIKINFENKYKNIGNNNELINKLKEENQSLKNKIKTLDYKIKEMEFKNNEEYNISKFKPGDKIISFIISSLDQRINRSFACKNTDIFVDVEKKLYDNYPEFKDIDTYFLCNGNKIKRFRTIEENGIIDGQSIIIVEDVNE